VVSQACPLSTTLFNIYKDEIITKWHKEDIKGISLPKNPQLLKLLLAYNQVLIYNTEDNLQKAAYNTVQHTKCYGNETK